MTEQTFIAFFAGLITSIILLFLKEKIEKDKRPEKYLEKIYEHRMKVYDDITKRLNNYTHYLVQAPLNFKDMPEFRELHKNFSSFVLDNHLHISDDLMRNLTCVLTFHTKTADKQLFEELIEARKVSLDLMRKDLGLPTIQDKFVEIFPEIAEKITGKNSK